MLCRRKIELLTSSASLSQPVISRELLADNQRAEHVLDNAQAQAETLLQQAQEQSAQILKQAHEEFWQRANQQLQRWEAERQTIGDQCERFATTITQQALSSLLEMTPPAERISALLNKLLDPLIPRPNAALACHPADQAHVEQWLHINTEVRWSLRLDDALPPQTLILETEEGSFHVEWQRAVESLFLLDPQPPRK